MTGSLDSIFNPASVAIVGASPNSPQTLRVASHMRRFGFKGDVWGVNPRYTDIDGTPTFPSLAELPGVPELVVIRVNNAAAVEALQQAAELGSKGATIPSIGFAEIDTPDGIARQARVREIAEQYGMKVIGPNCQGAINLISGANSFSDDIGQTKPGNAALISQSGSISSLFLSNPAGVRFAYAASTGNESVVSTGELAEYFLAQPEVELLVGFLETIRDPDRFFAAARAATEAGKAVAIVKSGRSDLGAQMAKAHSAAPRQDDAEITRLCKENGVARVRDFEDLLALAALLSVRRPKGGRLAGVAGSGGMAGLLLDEAAHAEEVTFPGLSEGMIAKVKADTGLATQPMNPIDYWGVKDPAGSLRSILQTFTDSDEVDEIVMPAYVSSMPGKSEGWADTQRALYRDVPGMPLTTVMGTIGLLDREQAADLVAEGISVASGLGQYIRGLDAWLVAQRGLRESKAGASAAGSTEGKKA